MYLRAAVLALAACSSSALGQWSTSGSNIYYNTGNVGIGALPSFAKLDVNSTTGRGVWADTSASSGAAVTGRITSTSNTNGAVEGITYSTAGSAGVSGVAQASTGTSIGVWGSTNAMGGSGVAGRSYHASGGVGVFAGVASSSAWAVYADGGRNYFSGNVGVGVTAPAAKLHVDGTVRLENLATVSAAPESVVTVNSSGDVRKMAVPLANGMKQWLTSGTWTVPAGVTKIKFEMWGAGGAGGITCDHGGSGAYGEGILSVISGETLTMTVGTGGDLGVSQGTSTKIVRNSSGAVLLEAGGGMNAETGGYDGGVFYNNVNISMIAQNGFHSDDDRSCGDYNSPPVLGPFVSGDSASLGLKDTASVGSGSPANVDGVTGCIRIQW